MRSVQTAYGSRTRPRRAVGTMASAPALDKGISVGIPAHRQQFFREFRREAILYCRDMDKLYLANPLFKGFCEKHKCKLRNVGKKIKNKVFC